VVEGHPIPETPPGGTLEWALEPFDVLNLETGDFNADFTGSVVEADQPVVVFTGGEASDAPFFDRLGNRRCCADHLEEQLDPIRTAGKTFVATISPNRSRALVAAGASFIGEVEQPEYFRIAAATEAGAVVRTTLAPPADRLHLDALGSFTDLTSSQDFLVESDSPIFLSSVSPSQAAAGIPRTLPGGDPSLLLVPPIEQFRSSYVFLTPDAYAFDFVRVIAPAGAKVLLDGTLVDSLATCRPSDDDLGTEWTVVHCQLGLPVLQSSPTIELSPGVQNDGVHEIVSSAKVGVLVDGFDRNVSYAYAAGTELVESVPR
jgi:hypothetical protein